MEADNKILKLFDKNFIEELFKKEVLPQYSDFSGIKKIEIMPQKKLIWESTYHVVVGYDITFSVKKGKNKNLGIFCTAHSSEPRKNVYKALKYLWDNSFASGYLTIPHPLFYSEYFNGTFYRGVNGENLYHYIRNKDFKEIESIVSKAAAWFAKLHRMPIKKEIDINKKNSRLRTVFPGQEHILDDINNNYPQYSDFYKKAYGIFIAAEEKFLNSTENRWVIHGDAHPENVIKMGSKKIAVIDYTDIGLSDFARDLGCFTQQIDYMVGRKIGDSEYAAKIKKLFLDNYVKSAKIKLDDSLLARIDNYYNWTAIRTATYFLIKYDAEPERAKPLIEQVKKNLKI